MVDTVTSLAISMQTKKGVFALLLGSGISRSAQIPTGWDIVLDLIRRLATAEGKTVSDDPAQCIGTIMNRSRIIARFSIF